MPEVRLIAILGVVAVVLSLAAPVKAQRAGRRVVTLDLLEEHPLFFHGEEVIVQADATGEGVLTYLVDDERRVLVLDVPPPPTGVRDRLEIIGTFYDVGRLEPGDPRSAGQPFERISTSLLDKPWPAVGELRLLVAESSQPVTEQNLVTLRTLALNPEAHLDEGVTLTGRFRGRNLYGDLPDSPGESPHDFVLTSADAAVWVVGQEPKGDGFDLDVQARIDTGRWLEVTGQVRIHEGMVILDAGSIRLAEPAENQAAPTRVRLRQGPAPEVIFSAPLDGDVDIPTDANVRLQFSRDMDPESFDERIEVSYVADAASARRTELPPLVFEANYRGLNRVLEIRFVEPLVAFQTINVRLTEGVAANDGAALAPWSLSFFVGR